MKRVLVYPAWKNSSVEHNEIKKRRIEERTEAFGGTLSVGRSSARIVGSVLFGRVEGVKEGRTRAAWQFPCHVSPTLGPAYDSDFPSVGSLPGPIGGPFLLVIRRVSLARVARFLSSVDKRRRDRFSAEGCHFQLVVGASEQTKCPRCGHASELLSLLSLFLPLRQRETTRRRRAWSTVCMYVRARTDDSRFHRVPRTFYGTLLRESSGNRDVLALVQSHRQQEGVEPSGDRTWLSCWRDTRFYLSRLTLSRDQGHELRGKNTISVKNATSIRKDAGLPRSSWSRTSFVPRSVKLGGGARPPPASGNARACPNTPELRYISSTYGVGRLPPAFRRPTQLDPLCGFTFCWIYQCTSIHGLLLLLAMCLRVLRRVFAHLPSLDKPYLFKRTFFEPV